jgi:hypothetical protein
MKMLALILGVLGGLCAIMGIIVATEAVSLTLDATALKDWMFWMILAGVLLLSCIATAVSSREEYE